jgi:hypothetical protein
MGERDLALAPDRGVTKDGWVLDEVEKAYDTDHYTGTFATWHPSGSSMITIEFGIKVQQRTKTWGTGVTWRQLHAL